MALLWLFPAFFGACVFGGLLIVAASFVSGFVKMIVDLVGFSRDARREGDGR